MTAENSRTALLDVDLISDLASRDRSLRDAAFTQLPDGLSREELSVAASLVSSIPDIEPARNIKRTENEFIYYLGCSALDRATPDLVTVKNAAKELRSRWDVLGSLILFLEVRRTRKRELSNLPREVSEFLENPDS